MNEYEITLITRQALADFFKSSGVNWSGRFEEPEFISRLYDLSRMPSTDRRCTSAAGDILTHRVSFNDWPNDWIFHDSRFDLMHVQDESFLRFLCETVHPEVRPDQEEAREIVAKYNRELAGDDYALVPVNHISRRPVYGAQKAQSRIQVFHEATAWQKVERQMREVRSSLSVAETEEQFQAVGLICREVLISVAQEVYDASRHPSLDGTTPSKTDAKRLLEAVIAVEFAREGNEQIRSIAKNSVQLSVALQHKRTADFMSAALCAEATAATVNLLAIVTGDRRGRKGAA
jgi:hypothetical protein